MTTDSLIYYRSNKENNGVITMQTVKDFTAYGIVVLLIMSAMYLAFTRADQFYFEQSIIWQEGY